jgi:hypothetical protein
VIFARANYAIGLELFEFELLEEFEFLPGGELNRFGLAIRGRRVVAWGFVVVLKQVRALVLVEVGHDVLAFAFGVHPEAFDLV